MLKKVARKKKKKIVEKVDGLSPKDKQRIRSAVRDVWRYSTPWKLVTQRCLMKDGFSKCEGCKKKCPKVYVDHIERVGDVDRGFIERMFVSSTRLQGLCKTCHDKKTSEERKQSREDKKAFERLGAHIQVVEFMPEPKKKKAQSKKKAPLKNADDDFY